MHRFYKRLMRADARISRLFSEECPAILSIGSERRPVMVIFESPDAPVRVPGGGEINDQAPAFSALTEDTRGNAMDEARLWFGLNAIKIKDLRGRIRGQRVRRHDLRDPVTGRFIKENRVRRRRRKASDPVFEPNGSFLSPAAYENGLVIRSRKENRRTIIIKNPETGRVREAEAGIYASTMDYVEDVAFAECLEIFMKEFESDIRRRAKYGITVAPR